MTNESFILSIPWTSCLTRPSCYKGHDNKQHSILSVMLYTCIHTLTDLSEHAVHGSGGILYGRAAGYVILLHIRGESLKSILEIVHMCLLRL